MISEEEAYNSLTDSQKANLWYIVAVQALHELGRSLILNEETITEIRDGKRGIYSKKIDDQNRAYTATRGKDETEFLL